MPRVRILARTLSPIPPRRCAQSENIRSLSRFIPTIATFQSAELYDADSEVHHGLRSTHDLAVTRPSRSSVDSRIVFRLSASAFVETRFCRASISRRRSCSVFRTMNFRVTVFLGILRDGCLEWLDGWLVELVPLGICSKPSEFGLCFYRLPIFHSPPLSA